MVAEIIRFNITGTLYDEDGSTPLEGIGLLIYEQQNIVDGFDGLTEVFTDVNGFFSIETHSTGDTLLEDWQWLITAVISDEPRELGSPAFRNPTFMNDYDEETSGVINQNFSKVRIGSGIVSGTISYDEDYIPIGVYALGSEKNGIADVYGRYTIRDLDAGTYIITPFVPEEDYIFDPLNREVTLITGETITGIDFAAVAVLPHNITDIDFDIHLASHNITDIDFVITPISPPVQLWEHKINTVQFPGRVSKVGLINIYSILKVGRT